MSTDVKAWRMLECVPGVSGSQCMHRDLEALSFSSLQPSIFILRVRPTYNDHFL